MAPNGRLQPLDHRRRILLLVKEAYDEEVYASLVVAINVFKMYRLNCVKLAPAVRGNLLRDIFTIRRH